MADEKSTEKVEKEKVIETPETTEVVETAPVQAAPKPKNKQTIIILAIVSAVVLFFVGFGLGYWLGHSTASKRTNFPNSREFPGNGGGRRFTPDSSNGSSGSTNNGSNSGTSSSNSNSKTQTN